ncbi:phage tail tape measure protein [Pantoea sp. YU22]|uniref:phage tail tape measure protein n=1 Tax=Pantoea sp. YU22 TaxID=2497684 RepID=UPI000F897A95|nr:phage tail tape measure protein [Pantoea sp. YU22]RTY53637.1 phage tail tape measure protein [Pantoea sp. YU22]
MADSFELKAIITAVDRLSGPVKGMQRQLKGFQKEFAELSVGAAAGGIAIAAALAVPINQAIDFESTMADVRKVVDGLDDPKVFAQMSDDILTLSTQLPMTADGIGQIMAAAGQAGISRNELQQFATDAVKMGIAFDQTAEEAGQTMAQWRTAFKLTQPEVVKLADQINYLSNNGPASAKSITDVITRIGSLGDVAGVSSADLAAMGATIAGMGVDSDVAATGVKNFMLSLVSGNASGTKAAVLKRLRLNPKELAAGMQKDSKATIIRVLDSIKKLPKARQASALEILFGRESIGAIAPLLNNLDLLKTNLDRVSDSKKYSNSMEKEYQSRAKTTANSLQLLRNQFSAISITLGDTFLPMIVEATKEAQPFLEQVRSFIKANPELIMSVAKFAGALLGVSVAVGAVSRAIKIMNFAMNMSPAKLAIAALVIGAQQIIEHWDEVGPVIKDVWQQVDSVAASMGGWQNVIEGVGLIMAGTFTKNTIGALREAVSLAGNLSGTLATIARFSGIALSITVAIYMLKQLKEIEDAVTKKDGTDSFWTSLKQRFSAGGWYNHEQQLSARTGQPVPRVEGGAYLPAVSLDRPVFDNSLNPGLSLDRPTLDRPVGSALQRGELKVSFENAPQGMRVAEIPKAGNPLMVTTDVGYSPFSLRRDR